jgi:DNA-binding CsgD family transcriptional regulator
VLLERDPFLAALREAPPGRLTLIGGEAGVGKTALVRDFCAGRPRVLWGACDALFTARALGPVEDVAEQAGGELAARLREGARPAELAAALLRELRAAPAVLVLEDLHWGDEGTLDVVRMLGRRAHEGAGQIVATFRDDELDAVHPLRIVLGELATSPGVRRLRLAPLSLGAVRTLAEPHGIDPERLHAITGGNPFYVTEVLGGGAAGPIPPTVRDAVLGRAAGLPDGARAVLDRVAIVPGAAEPALLGGAPDADVDACLRSGVLREAGAAVAFRHELARLAVEEAIPPRRRAALHREALAALEAAGADPARLAHHAEAAGDGAAVLRHARAAAERAARAGAHREAAGQYARALRFAAALGPGERAELLERRSYQCYLTDQIEPAIAARTDALALRRELGDALREGDDERWLSRLNWFLGRNEESERLAAAAVERLAALPPGRELAMAYSNRAQLAMLATDRAGAQRWGGKAIELAERLGDAETLAHALNNVGTAEHRGGVTGGLEKLERSLAIAVEADLEEHVARAHCNLASAAADARDIPLARRRLEEGIGYCDERDLDSWRLYLLAWRAIAECEAGAFGAAADAAAEVLRHPSTAPISRIPALAALGRVRARRGDPGAAQALDEALALARPTGELQRLAPVAAARAELAWLAGDAGAAAAATDLAWDAAVRVGEPWFLGELAAWRARAGVPVPEEARALALEPYALELAGELAAAADRWEALGCAYEAALARARAGDDAGFTELDALGARAVARRLGRRGPHAATRENPAGLTARELEVLALVSAGLQNAEIAQELVLSVRTVDHHVSAILRKLGAPTRGRATAEATRLGITA